MGCIIAERNNVKMQMNKAAEEIEQQAKQSIEAEIIQVEKIKTQTIAEDRQIKQKEAKEKAGNISLIDNARKKSKKAIAKSFIGRDHNVSKSNVSMFSNKSTAYKKRRNTLYILDNEDKEDTEVMDFAKVTKALYQDMVEITVKANEIKFDNWIPVVTKPNKDIYVYVEGKWTIDESKRYVSHKGYPGQNVGNLVVKILGREEEIKINDSNAACSCPYRLPLVVGFNFGKFIDYKPQGELKLRILGCEKVSPELALPGYYELCTALSFALENELNEEVIQIVYFIDAFRTPGSPVFKRYQDKKPPGGVEYKEDLSELAAMFLSAELKGNLTENFIENSKKAVGYSQRVTFFNESYEKGHDSAYLKVLKLIENTVTRSILAEKGADKIGVALKPGKLAAVHLGLVIAE